MPLPPRLHPGDTVGIFSPSFPTSAEAVETMRRYFESQGIKVLVAPNTLAVDGLMAGTSQQRADDLNSLLRNPSIRMVMTSMGGAGAIHLLPLIDYAALSANPKIIAALSDPSILLCAITACTGIPTFHGPNGVEFGGLDVLTPYSEENFLAVGEHRVGIAIHFSIGRRVSGAPGWLAPGRLPVRWQSIARVPAVGYALGTGLAGCHLIRRRCQD